MEHMRVFVGGNEQQLVPTKVLAWSIKKHTKTPFSLVPLYTVQEDFPTPQNPANRPRTPFSFQRFFIPKAAGYHGKAVYLDSDMIVLDDLQKLYEVQGPAEADLYAIDPVVGKDKQYAVMVLLCDRLAWDIREIVARMDRGELNYERLMFNMEVATTAGVIPARWNRLDEFVPGDTSLLHYTDMSRQPWLRPGHPEAQRWYGLMHEAIDAGELDPELVREHVGRKWLVYDLRF